MLSKDEMGAEEEGCRGLFEDVVKMRRLSICGRRFARRKAKSAIGTEAAVGMDRVGGRLSPGNDVKRTLIMGGVILCGMAGEYGT